MNLEFLVLAAVAVMIGGLVKGLSGFGYAIVSTSLLASLYEPSRAVSFMIIPLIAIQLELVNNLDRNEIKTCTNNFRVYITSLIAGTMIGFYSLSLMPVELIKFTLGIITFVFALSRTEKFSFSIEKLKKKCFRRSATIQGPLGVLSGIIFGGTNVGVQIVAYLKAMELSNRKFVGLLALIMIPVSGLRIPLILNQIDSLELIGYSILAAPLGMAAAWVGSKMAERTSSENIEHLTLILLILISLNLIRTSVL